MSRERPRRDDYAAFLEFTTRWRDNDVYGHMNNVVYYEYFDTAVNRWYLESGALEVPGGEVVGLVVETRCTYAAPVGFPDRLTVGLRAARIGETSATFALAIFREGEAEAAAHGAFTHVYVDAESRRPAPLPQALRAALERIA